jgi:hypothetical protein
VHVVPGSVRFEENVESVRGSFSGQSMSLYVKATMSYPLRIRKEYGTVVEGHEVWPLQCTGYSEASPA